MSQNLKSRIISRNRSYSSVGLALAAFSTGILLGYLLWGVPRSVVPTAADENNQPANPTAAQQAETAPDETPQITRYPIETDGFPSLGPQDAAITIVKFTDFQCPYCKRWQDEVFQQLLTLYPNQIRLVMRNFPLESIHPNAFFAAEAALCAGDQNAYWGYVDQLYMGKYGLNREAYGLYAEELMLDTALFSHCIEARTHQRFVQEDMDFAIDLGIRSTPTFFVNGLALVGAQPLSVFQQVVDQELAGEIP